MNGQEAAQMGDYHVSRSWKGFEISGKEGIIAESLSADEAYKELKKLGIELPEVTEVILDYSEATTVAAGMTELLGEDISGGLLSAFSEVRDIEIDPETLQIDDSKLQEEFLSLNKALQSEIKTMTKDDADLFQDYINGNFSSLNLDQVQEFFERLTSFGGIGEEIANLRKQQYEEESARLNEALEGFFDPQILDKFTLEQKQKFAERMKDLTDSEKTTLANYYNEISKVSGEIDGQKIADLGMQVDASDSNALFQFLLKIEEKAPGAVDAINAIKDAINLLDVDVIGQFSGISESMSSELDQIENAYEDGLEKLTDVQALIEASNGTLTGKDFSIGPDDKYYINTQEAAERAALAVQELKKAEFERSANATLNLLGIDTALTESNREYVKSLIERKVTEELLNSAELNTPAVQKVLSENNIALSATTYKLAKAQLELAINTLEAKEAMSGLSADELIQLSYLRSAVADLEKQSGQLDAASDLITTLEITSDQFYDTGLATDRFKDKSSDAKDAVDSLTDSLNKEKEALEKLRDTTKDSASTLYDAMKDRLEAELDYYQNAVSNYYDALDQALEELIDKAQDGLDELNDKADELSSIAEENGDDLQSIADAVIEYYDSEINAIQAKIDALNDEADATEKLQKLQEARDAYEKAKQKTRLVLTNGGGWRFKTDAAALEEAGSELASAEQEHQVDLLQQQIDALEQIKSQWEEIAKGIGKATSEIEKEANFQAYLNGLNQNQLDSLKNQFGQQVGINNVLNEQALQAQNKYEQENNASAQGTLAWQINQWQNAQQQAQQDQNQFDILTDPNAKAVADLKAQLLQQLGDAGEMSINQALQSGLNIITDSAEKVNAINSALEKLEQLMDTIDMTSAEIRDYNSIISEVNSASLDSLLEDGTTYNQLLSQWEETIALNDKISDLQARIDEIEGSEDGETNTGTVAAKTSSLAENVGGGDAGSGEDTVYGQNQVQNTNLEGLIDKVKLILSNLQVFEAGQSMESYISRIVATIELVIDAVNSIEPRVGGESAGGGLVGSTGLWAVHGTQTHPEMMLNANQSAKLFQWIDSLPNHLPSYSIPSFASGSLSREQKQEEGSPQFMNCDFNISSSADSLDGLIADIKRKVPLR